MPAPPPPVTFPPREAVLTRIKYHKAELSRLKLLVQIIDTLGTDPARSRKSRSGGRRAPR